MNFSQLRFLIMSITLCIGTMPIQSSYAQINTATLVVKEKAHIDSIPYNCTNGWVQVVISSPPATCTYYVNSVLPNTITLPPSNNTGTFDLSGVNVAVFQVESNGCYTDTTVTFDCNNPLPITILNFSAVLFQKDKGLLQWTVNEQHNVANYELEQSKDGITYEQLSSIPINNTTNDTASYQYIDDQLWTGLNFYRLKVVQLNGAYYYSPIRTILYEEEDGIIVALYPNPTNGEINIAVHSNKDDEMQINILDNISRQIIPTQNFTIKKGDNLLKIDISHLAAAGYYFFCKTKNSSFEKVIKVIKKD